MAAEDAVHPILHIIQRQHRNAGAIDRIHQANTLNRLFHAQTPSPAVTTVNEKSLTQSQACGKVDGMNDLDPQAPVQPHIKQKLPAFLSYPLKFSEIQRIIGTPLQALPVEVYFGADHSNRLRQGESRSEYPVISAGYSPTFPPPWRLQVFPVPKDLRFRVHLLLFSCGLDALKEFFCLERTSLWLAEEHQIRLSYEATTDELLLAEAAKRNSPRVIFKKSAVLTPSRMTT